MVKYHTFIFSLDFPKGNIATSSRPWETFKEYLHVDLKYKGWTQFVNKKIFDNDGGF